MKRMRIRWGKFALVDDELHEGLKAYCWEVSPYGYAVRRYRAGKIQKVVFMHREILGLRKGDGKQVDHKNGNRLDNRKENLRICSNAQNQRNCKKHRNGKCRFKGVYRGSSEYTAQIRLGGKSVRIGGFLTQELAARAYDDAAKKHYGEFARLNFPPPVSEWDRANAIVDSLRRK